MDRFPAQTNLLDFAVQGWPQLAALGTALVLCSLIGLEREIRQKSAGLRTHTLVGLGAALFMVISKYGFGDVLTSGEVMLDPSRVAAQIVSGVGFIGAGMIFVQRNAVRGLTTAAVVWVSAAVGTACGAGLWVVAAFVTAAHFLVVYGYPPLIRWLSRRTPRTSALHVNYEDGRGALRSILEAATHRGFVVEEVSTRRRVPEDDWPGGATIDLALKVRGAGEVGELAAQLSETSGVRGIQVGGDPRDEEI